ncbi:MAG: hypothetical protein KJP23_17815 [Deltaproteobacteria bacterium]|nr:hypothetical protein [Deltaproteobacteria bacterium]
MRSRITVRKMCLPKYVTRASGSILTTMILPAEGANFNFAQAYREILSREGVTLDLRSTAGSVENLKLLGAASGGGTILPLRPDFPAALSSLLDRHFRQPHGTFAPAVGCGGFAFI